ncbi:hypothetical protein R84B8_01596 [Treponema sp. R8-4-B8]
MLASCEDPVSDNASSKETLIEFKNLEQFPVTIYSDSLRNNAFADVSANSTKIVPSNISSTTATAFYPTFNLIYPVGTPVINTITIPYNGPSFVHNIEANKTTTVPIPKLESIYVNSSYLLIINKSNHSLALSEGGPNEKAPLNGGSTVINSGGNAAYSVNPGAVSGYSVMVNTTTPIAFPADFTEFRRGIIHVITYNGTNLVLTEEKSVLQTLSPETPANVRVEDVSLSGVQIAWDAVYGATAYQVYRAAGSASTSYSKVANVATLSWTNIGLAAGQIYYYKVSAVSSAYKASAMSAVVSAVMPPANVRVTAASTSSVVLAWDAFSGASGYIVYRSDSEGGEYAIINPLINGTTFTDAAVSAFTTYYYKVSAIIGGVEGLQSNVISASTGINISGGSLAVKLAWLQSNALSNNLYFIDIDADESIGPQSLSYSGKSGITITMNGGGAMKTVSLSSNGALFTVGSGVTLTLNNNITLKGMNNNTSPLVFVNSGGNFILNGGKISGNTFTASSGDSHGGGVYVNGGTFTMNSGVVSGNTAVNGGGVFNSGTFTMNGGAISGNAGSTSGSDASHGGGVFVNGGTFTMSGGAISGNIAANGGGVFNGGTFILSGGEISGNTISSSSGNIHGGGVFTRGTFTMSGGAISGNTGSRSGSDSSYGGGVFVNGGTFTMNNGAVSGNTVSSLSGHGAGGGVYLQGGTFTMNGGAVSGNAVPISGGAFGGGICVRGGTFTMNDGDIYGNSVSPAPKGSARGGGVDVETGNFIKTGGTIYGYTSGDANSNTVQGNRSGTVVSNCGHAVYAYINASSAKRKETTAGTWVSLSFNYNNGSPVFSGRWDY